MKERDGVRYTVGSGRMFVKTLEDAASQAVANPYIKSPVDLVLYEVRPIIVHAQVVDRRWQFKRKED